MRELKLVNSLVDGRYEVSERLNRGSYAEIFVARDREAAGREVVIKALNTSLQGTPDADLERTLVENFQNEALALDAVRHPHVILRWGHGTAADLQGVPFHYLVLEYMAGGDLLKLCRLRPGDRLPVDEALSFFKQACEALAFAHSKDIIHRDLKPNNLLLSADHRILKIADFGVAKITTNDGAEITRVGADIYAPPEHNPFEESDQAERLTASADIYSLAKSFYTVVCGRAPGQFKCDPITELPSDAMNKRWGRPLLLVLQRATDDDPGKRYSTVIDFWNDLVRIAAFLEEDSIDDETIVKPRLTVSPGNMPKMPITPDFEPALASPGSPAAFVSATPVKPRPLKEFFIEADKRADKRADETTDGEKGDDRPGKIFVELPKPKPVVVNEKPVDHQNSGVVVEGNKTGSDSSVKKEANAAPVKTVIKRDFSETLRRRIFISLIVLALTGALVSIYNYGRNRGLAFGLGLPTEIEVTAPGLNVRGGPSPRDPVLGVVGKGSKHRVLARSDQQWLQIKVQEWDESVPHVADQDTGWVYGNPDYVRVISRQWW